MKDEIFHLISLDSIGGDAIYICNDKMYHISMPYEQQDITECEISQINRIHFNEAPDMKFFGIQSMIKHIEKSYCLNKLEERVLEKINEEVVNLKYNVIPEIVGDLPSTKILDLINNHHPIEFFYPRYLSGKLFEFDTKLPNYIKKFRDSLRDSIKEDLQFLNSVKVELKENQSRDFNFIVDESLAGSKFILEPVYAGEKRKERAEFIEFGTIDEFCIALNKDSRLADYVQQKLDVRGVTFENLKKEVGTNRIESIRKFLDIVVINKSSILMMPSTLISEEYNKLVSENDLYKSIKTHMTDDPAEIRRKLAGKNSNSVAFLDWQISEKLTRKKNLRSHEKIRYHGLVYSKPISVGLPYPKNDKKFQKWIADAIINGYIQDGDWDEEFLRHMKDCQVKLVEAEYLSEIKAA